MASSGVLGALLVLLQLGTLHICASQTVVLPDKGVVASQMVKLMNSLKLFLQEKCGYYKLTKEYNGFNRENVNFARVNGMSLAKEMAQSLGYVLGKKTEALKRSVEFAEEAAQNYTWSRHVEVDYVAAKTINDSLPEFEYSPLFKQRVSFNSSSIHIPVEIYDGNIDILNDLKWSSAIDEIWKENREKDPELLWQYFGSQKGVMRSFPASKWKTTGKVDLYDVRRRPWYTQGASSPKDMLILVDVSGSTHGQALQLMKVSISSLLDTLGENDFVLIVAFSEKARIVGCFGTFVQATYRNKEVLNHYVEQLNAKGMASYKTGLVFAFEQFNKFKREAKDGQGANCNRVIMFLTDGGTEMPNEVFEEYNWPDNPVRIFTYAVGPTAGPLTAVRWMACANKGYFSKIPAMGAIRSTVQAHVPLVARPLALGHIPLIQWSNVYYGQGLQIHASVVARPWPLHEVRMYHWSSIYSDALSNYNLALGNTMSFSLHHNHGWSRNYLDFWGLGLMTTVTLPVYNKTDNALSNQTILGVMGVDITVSDMQLLIPYRKLGPNGYAFAINNNGYIVFHPLLKAQNGYLKDPPNVDFLEVEYDSNEKKDLRKMMILGNEGKTEIRTHVIVPDELHTDIIDRTYYYTNVPGSNFSMAVVLPKYAQFYANVGGYSRSSGIRWMETTKSAVLVAPWEYCTNITQLHNESTPLMDLIDQMMEDYDSCNQDLLQHLFWDLKTTKVLEDFWANKMKDESVQKVLEAMFVSTNGGLTRVYPPSAGDKLEGFLDTWKAVYYKRAFDNNFWLYSVPYRAEPDQYNVAPSVMAARAVNFTVPDSSSGEIYKPAVIGALINEDRLRLFMTHHVNDCAYNTTFTCYLVDDGGFIITTNQEDELNKVGMFLGDRHVDPGLMKYLYNKTNPPIFERKVELDYQAACPDVPQFYSAGPRSVYIPAFYEMLTVHWWTSKLAWLYMNFNLYNWLFSGYSNYAYAEDEWYTYGEVQNRSCVIERAQYFYGEMPLPRIIKGKMKCPNCTREFMVVKVTETNMLLVMSLKDCGSCDSDDTELKHRPTVVHDVSTDPEATCSEEKLFRTRPWPCYDYSPYEDHQDCGANNLVYPSIALLLMALQVTWLYQKILLIDS